MTDRVRALLWRIGNTSEVAADSREAREILKEVAMQDATITMTCGPIKPEPPAPDSDYVRGIKKAMEIAAVRVPDRDGSDNSRPRDANEIIHALGQEIDYGAL